MGHVKLDLFLDLIAFHFGKVIRLVSADVKALQDFQCFFVSLFGYKISRRLRQPVDCSKKEPWEKHLEAGGTSPLAVAANKVESNSGER
jgi:hypothetical protein